MGSAFHRFTFFFSYLGPPGVFKLGVWDENLVLHPKLNAQLFIDIHRDLCREGAAPTRFYFVTGSSCYLLLRLFFHMQMHRLSQVHLIFIDIYRHLCLCASFLVRNAGGGAAPSPLHPLHPLFMVQKVISNTKWFPRTDSYLPYIHACNVFPNHWYAWVWFRPQSAPTIAAVVAFAPEVHSSTCSSDHAKK